MGSAVTDGEAGLAGVNVNVGGLDVGEDAGGMEVGVTAGLGVGLGVWVGWGLVGALVGVGGGSVGEGPETAIAKESDQRAELLSAVYRPTLNRYTAGPVK